MGNTSNHYEHNAAILSQLRPGDLLELPHTFYSHWAVYVGNEEVVHVTGNSNIKQSPASSRASVSSVSGVTTEKAQVCKDDFWDVVKGAKACINNNMDRRNRPLPRMEIVKRALQRVGQKGYNIFTRNCEHFANLCRYGIAKSEQVRNFMGKMDERIQRFVKSVIAAVGGALLYCLILL